MLNALTFVPLNNVVESFAKLLDTELYTQIESIFTPLLSYFEDTWIGRI